MLLFFFVQCFIYFIQEKLFVFAKIILGKKEHDNYKRKRYIISYSTIYTKVFELS